MSNITDILADTYGDGTAVILDKGLKYKSLEKDALTYNEIAAIVNKISKALIDNFKVEKGERIIVYKSNEIDFILILFAVMRAGAVAVPLNSLLKEDEVNYIISNCGAKILITDHDSIKNNFKDNSRLPGVEHIIIAGVVDDAFAAEYTGKGFSLLDDMINATHEYAAPVEINMDDPAAIFYTSGTTGEPKGAVLTSRALLSGQKAAALILPFRKSDLAFTALPQAHIMGFASTLVALLNGLPGYFMNDFNSKKTLNIIKRKRITIFIGVPAMYAMMLQRNIEKYDLSSIRIWFSSGDSMNAGHIKTLAGQGAFLRLFGKKIIGSIFISAYGMVELAGAAFLKVHLPGFQPSDNSLGYPLPSTRSKIVDNQGNETPEGEAGELLIKSPGATAGYFNNTEATNNLFAEGWLKTGDMARKGEFKEMFFVDREKDVIKAAGYSIFSAEVEDAILRHPKIASCVVIGIPSAIGGNQPLAVVTIKNEASTTEHEIYFWCKDNIAAYKCPREIKIIHEDEMPYGATMKIKKRELKERFKNEFSFKWMDVLGS